MDNILTISLLVLIMAVINAAWLAWHLSNSLLTVRACSYHAGYFNRAGARYLIDSKRCVYCKQDGWRTRS
jgi:hypothetical protein